MLDAFSHADPVTEALNGATELVLSRRVVLSTETIQDLSTVADGLRHLRVLDLSSAELDSFPEWILELTALERLVLSDCGLSSIPQDIGRLRSLQFIHLEDNQLTALPASLFELPALTRMLVHRNELGQLPNVTSPGRALRELSVASNPLDTLPAFLGASKGMEALAIGDTGIHFLPEWVRDLKSLEYLAAGGGVLRELPDWIGELQGLKGLELTRGRRLIQFWCLGETHFGDVTFGADLSLSQLPVTLRDIPGLRQLYLHGNDALHLPESILGPSFDETFGRPRGTKKAAKPASILDYYLRTRRGRRRLNEAKLILVGRGGVGKTSLINQLVHARFDEREPETAGIQIQTWPVTLADSDAVRLHVWDFGGQEILHSTHQFFLTERTIYLLVLSGREGNPTADAEYWLQLIRSFGSESRVLIALNKCRQHPFDVNRGFLLEKYPFIADFVHTDCKGDPDGPTPAAAVGIEALRGKILGLTETMEHRKVDFPADWFAIKERLAGMSEDFMSWEEYQRVCRQLGESDPAAQRDLAKFLHILGIALNYSDDPRLEDTRVLKPRWVTEGIYTLLRAGQRSGRTGVLTREDMADTLDPDRYPAAKHEFLIRLMERFQLCFRLPGLLERYFVPELLGESQPNLETLLGSTGLGFRYQYEVLPEGLLPRFIVQSHVYSEHYPGGRWRTGVVLERDGCTAIVRADLRERRVDAFIAGPDARRRGLLEIIREKFEQQHADLKGLVVEERVPLPDDAAITVSYRHLLFLEEEGEDMIRPEGSKKKYSVVELLNGVESVDSRARRRDRASGKTTTAPRGADQVSDEKQRDKIFVSYSHKDKHFYQSFRSMMAPAIRREIVELWGDDRIRPGERWKEAIAAALASTRVAVLLVSRNFLESDFIAKHELPPLLAAAREAGVTVFWICVSPCLYEQSEIAEYQAAHDVSKPLSTLDKPQREAELSRICTTLVRQASEGSNAAM